MSLFVLLVVVWIALILSNIADGLSISGLFHLPRWLLWAGAIALTAWCMDADDNAID